MALTCTACLVLRTVGLGPLRAPAEKAGQCRVGVRVSIEPVIILIEGNLAIGGLWDVVPFGVSDNAGLSHAPP